MAVIAFNGILPQETADESILWAFVIAATPLRSNRDLSQFARRANVTSEHRALRCVIEMGRAIRSQDWQTARRQMEVIRHYGPDISRTKLHQVLHRIASDQIAPDHADSYFRDISALIAA